MDEMNLSGKNIIVAVSGGIAAYKAADLCSKLSRHGASVRVAFSANASQFISPLTFEALTGHPVYSRLFQDPHSHEMEHITWSRWADLLVIAPASANSISKMAAGAADDAVSTLFICFEKPILIAPSMNTRMWNNPATRQNVSTLTSRGILVMRPGEGDLACGESGAGRMPEPDQIIEALTQIASDGFTPVISENPPEKSTRQTSTQQFSTQDSPTQSSAIIKKDDTLSGITVLITSGPTREYLDPMRYISNPSSGKMGAALAREAMARSANVIFITGPVEAPQKPHGATIIEIETADQMLEAVRENAPTTDIFLFAAAVGDFKPTQRIANKIKRTGNSISLALVENPDIAQVIGLTKRPDQVALGFAAETDDLIANATAKLKRKKLDAIISNVIGEPGTGFQSDENEVTIILADGPQTPVSRRTKQKIAEKIIETATQCLAQKRPAPQPQSTHQAPKAPTA
jgi:phosphopantothenoylcysteine decarboxylase/phosphopantothenate--cysteine ligase